MITYHEELYGKIREEGDLTLEQSFIEFLLNSHTDKILRVTGRSRYIDIPMNMIKDCHCDYDRFYVEYKEPVFDEDFKGFKKGEEIKYPSFEFLEK